MAWWTNSITDVLNQWSTMGVFSYVIPFMLIFAVVFAILSKMSFFKGNNPVSAIIAAAIGLLSLQFDFVSTFFAEIFPRFGVGIAVLLVLLIFLTFVGVKDTEYNWVGWVLGIGVVVWAVTSWNFFGDNSQIGIWLQENFWSLIVIVGIVLSIYLVAKTEGEAHGEKKDK